jgi:hypothetical protein
MAEINFVADPGNQQPKNNDPGEEKITWSEAEKQAAKPGVFSFLKGKAEVTPGSRNEALQMIKSYVKEKESAPLDSIAPPATPSAPVQPSKPAGRILEMKVHNDNAPEPGKTGQHQAAGSAADKISGFAGFFKKFFAKKSKQASGGHILATDLISGEVTVVFDWKKNILVLAFFVVVAGLLLVGIYQGLVLWEDKKITEAIRGTEKFNELNTQISLEEKGIDEIIDLQKKLELIKQLLDRHIYWSNFFAFLERDTLADVYFDTFSGDTNGIYPLTGTTKDFKTLADQLTTLQADKMVNRATSRGGSAAIDKEGNTDQVTFNLELSVKKELFNKTAD